MATFEHFYKSLSPNSQVRGKEFEKLVKWFLQTDPRWNNLVKKVWLWDEHPQRDEWGPDCGIDLVFEDLIGNNWAVQAKCFDSHNSIRKEHMDSFIAESSDSRFQKRLLVTSTDNIGPNVERLLSRHKVVKILLEDLVNADLEYPEDPINFKNAKRKDPPKPYPHQEEAIKDVLKRLRDEDKGQVLMACGTGKTLTALWIKERLKAENVLVLLPSLSLLSQTLKEWNKAAKDKFKWICVCSDKSVAKEDKSNDNWISNTSDIGVPVTSSTEDIKKFLSEKGSKIIFSTYQSSSLIVDVHNDENIPPFEIVFADEAHRCAGKVSKTFSFVLDEKKIRANKRLFFTATPIILSNQIKKQASVNDIEIASMDDISKFGNIFHQLKFSDAINRVPPLLTDYQVVIVGVDDPLIQQQIINRNLLTSDEENIYDAERLAASISVIKSIKDYNLKRIISFHNKVKSAEKFSSDIEKIYQLIPTNEKPSWSVNSDYVSGSMNTNKRNTKLKRLKNLKSDETRILSNARCLSEGVDVPTLDGIAFIDPKSSQIDIIQAVGRAIRKSEEKKIGTIIIPVYLGDTENLEEEILASKFNNVWKIILALKSQDDSLMETIDRLRIQIGRGSGTSRGGDGLEKIVIVPEKISNKFSKSIKTLLVKNTSENWYERYGELLKFFETSQEFSPEKNTPLMRWVNWQRHLYKENRLSKERINKLNEIDKWVWNEIDAYWENMYRKLIEFKKKYGHARPPQRKTALGSWIQTQRARYKRNQIHKEQIEKLNQISDWSWDPFRDDWFNKFEELKLFIKENGHARPPQRKSVLGTWCNKQRSLYKKGKLPQEYIQLLESLRSWTWDPNESDWEDSFIKVENFIDKYGHMKIHETNKELVSWVDKQRRSFKDGTLSKIREDKLSKLVGWVWDPLEKIWDEKFAEFKIFVSENGHANIPQSHPTLGSWVGRLRNRYKKGTLEIEKIKILESYDQWEWNILDAKWEENYEKLLLFIKKHQRLPPQSESEGKWANKQRQRYRKNVLEEKRIQKLNNIELWVWEFNIKEDKSTNS
uniref:Putative helicase n=1 Tax=uncultured Prochlorococcus marinus clone ASNC612 TaxID=379370 RepID=Q1PKQ2_PROMR|nr:putative helicase [uncultured Prochlorococcus marinus clone ASNC612]